MSLVLAAIRWPSASLTSRASIVKSYGTAWKVKGRFCDPQGAGDRIIFNNHGLGSTWPIKTRNKIRFIETVQNLVIDDRFAVDVDQAPVFCEEVEAWQKDPKTGKELDKFNHAMAAWRYGISNAEVIESKRREMMQKASQGSSRPILAMPPRDGPCFSSHADVAREWRDCLRFCSIAWRLSNRT